MGRHLWLHLAVLAAVLIATGQAALSSSSNTDDKVAFDQELNTISDTDDHADQQSLKDILRKNPKLALADDYRFNKMLKTTTRPTIPTTEKVVAQSKPTETSFDVDASHSEVTKATEKKIPALAGADEEEEYPDPADDDYYYEEDEDDVTLAATEKSKEAASKKLKPLKPLKGDDSLPPSSDEDDLVVKRSSTSNPPPMTSSTTVTPTPTPTTTTKKTTTASSTAKEDAEEADDDVYDEADDDNLDYEEDEDEDDDQDDDLDDDIDLKGDTVPCPRDCVCHISQSDTLIATCSRLDLEVQKFSSAITDLEVMNIEPKYPIILSENFFSRIGLKRVITIKIVNCTIESVAPSAFNGLIDLFAVNLTNTGLDMLHPDTFLNNTKLKILTLAGNNLSAMQESPSPFTNYMLNAPSVEELNLANCNLTKLLPTAFDRLKRIVYINLSDNDIETLPENLFRLANTIEELDLSFNGIKSLPKFIFTQTSLAMLHLKYNKISDSLDFLTGDLQKLDLSYNKIEAISADMFKSLSGLQSLELKGNDITRIHQAAFMTLKALRNVDLSFTKLDQVPAMLFLKNTELDVIKLNDNPNLKTLPAEGFVSEKGFFSVYHFDVSTCDISALGDNTFKTMPYLSRLNLAWNNLDYVNDKLFAPLKKLKDLDLTNNILENMHDDVFVNNYELTKLSLAGNNFNEFNPSTFKYLPKLADLDLSDCDFSRLWTKKIAPETFPSLKYLNVSNNVLKELSPSDFNHMPNLIVLDISENALSCDANFKALMTWVVKQRIEHGRAERTHAEMKLSTLKAKWAQKDVQGSWQSLAYSVCTSDKESLAVEEEEEDGDSDAEDSDVDYDSYFDEVADQITKEDEKLKTKTKEVDDGELVSGGLTVTEVERKTGKKMDIHRTLPSHPIIDENSFEEIFDELERHQKEESQANFMRQWGTIAIFTLCCVMLMLIIVRIVLIMLEKRHERYRQAILASKNSFVYQKLSEEIGNSGKVPSIPKVHRYQPIQQV